MTPTVLPPPDEGVWADIRLRYERGEEQVKVLATALGLSAIVLSKKAKALGWKMRGEAKALVKKKQSLKSESTTATIKRLKELLQNRIATLETEIKVVGAEINALSNEREIRSVNTLVRTLEKVIDLERKDRSRRQKVTRDFKRFDDQQRGELAEKIGRLQQTWRGHETVEQLVDTGSGGAEHPVALLGEKEPAVAA